MEPDECFYGCHFVLCFFMQLSALLSSFRLRDSKSGTAAESRRIGWPLDFLLKIVELGAGAGSVTRLDLLMRTTSAGLQNAVGY